jgi:hypothetical protein
MDIRQTVWWLMLGHSWVDGVRTDRQTWLPNKPLLLLKEHPVIKRLTSASLAAERKCCVEQVERKCDMFWLEDLNCK